MRLTFRFLITAIFALHFVILSSQAFARAHVEVIQTDPPGSDVVLGLNQNYSLKIAYDTDEPIQIWARPYYKGNQVPAMSNASSKYEGTGHALGWFAFTEPAEVDEVRILVGRKGASGNGELALNYPVTIRAGTDKPTPSADQPVWLGELLDQNRAIRAEESEARMNEPISALDIAIMATFMVGVLGFGFGGLVAPTIAFWKWDGGWRIAAAIPGVVLILVIGRIIIDTAIDPTSHNLWPFEILMFGFISTVFVLALTITRFILRRTGARLAE